MSVTDMTCEEVNRELAKRRGDVDPMRIVDWNGQSLLICKEGIEPPDYCHDWQWAGLLMEEMGEHPQHIARARLAMYLEEESNEV